MVSHTAEFDQNQGISATLEFQNVAVGARDFRPRWMNWTATKTQVKRQFSEKDPILVSMVPYWSIAVPLTCVSLWLLLGDKARRESTSDSTLSGLRNQREAD